MEYYIIKIEKKMKLFTRLKRTRTIREKEGRSLKGMRKVVSWFFLLALAITLVVPAMAATPKVYHVPVENEVEKGLLAYLQRAVKEAEQNNAEAIVLDIHTPGGFVDAASDIGKLLANTKVKIISYINTEAHSAGAFIALHGEEVYFAPGATMGAAAVIDSAGKAADVKAQSAWNAQMEGAAKIHDRDPKYALAMADDSIDLTEYRAPVGKLLTLQADEAKEIGYSNGTAATLADVLEMAGLSNAEVVPVDITLSEQIARIVTNPIVVPILLSIASIGLVVELYSPGFGIPGLMGLSSLGLFFFGHTIAGFAGYESIIMLVIGLILVVLELFMPGGIIGFIGVALIVVSLLMAGANFVHMAYSILIAIILAILGMVILMKFFGKKLHMFNKLVLTDATTTEEGYVSNVNRLDLIGKVGVTVTQMRPSGVIMIDLERIDAVSEGSYIDVDKKIEVVKVEGSRIVVRQI